MKDAGGPSPDFWRLLGRARRAAGLLGAGWALADAAIESGYSDQAHMTRAFRRWIGAPPAALCADTGLLSDVTQPGLGNWTGEQISTR
jgi:AraC-like DNA-binding protein